MKACWLRNLVAHIFAFKLFSFKNYWVVFIGFLSVQKGTWLSRFNMIWHTVIICKIRLGIREVPLHNHSCSLTLNFIFLPVWPIWWPGGFSPRTEHTVCVEFQGDIKLLRTQLVMLYCLFRSLNILHERGKYDINEYDAINHCLLCKIFIKLFNCFS